MNLDPKTPTVPKVTTDRFSFKKVSFLKLSATFPASILEETAFNIGWNNQIFTKEMSWYAFFFEINNLLHRAWCVKIVDSGLNFYFRFSFYFYLSF